MTIVHSVIPYGLFYRLKPVRILFLRNIYLANTIENNTNVILIDPHNFTTSCQNPYRKQTRYNMDPAVFRASLVRVGFQSSFSILHVSPDGQGILFADLDPMTHSLCSALRRPGGMNDPLEQRRLRRSGILEFQCQTLAEELENHGIPRSCCLNVVSIVR
jgi:hypothetical protein